MIDFSTLHVQIEKAWNGKIPFLVPRDHIPAAFGAYHHTAIAFLVLKVSSGVLSAMNDVKGLLSQTLRQLTSIS